MLCACFFVIFAALSIQVGARTKYILNLDVWTWEKVVTDDRILVVRFGVEWPHGDQHDAFTGFAEDVASVNIPVIVGEVRSKENGPSRNQPLFDKYDLRTSPAFLLFRHGNVSRFKAPQDTAAWRDALRRWVVLETGHWIPLHGTHPALHRFVRCIWGHPQISVSDALSKIEQTLLSSPSLRETTQGETFFKILKWARECPDEGCMQAKLTAEKARILRLLAETSSPLHPKVYMSLTSKLNVLLDALQ